MSNNQNNNEQNSKQPLKPLAMPGKLLYTRTVSAQPTLGDSTQSSSNPDGTKDSGVKLNTNAPVFVPKEKRTDTSTTTSAKVDKDNTPNQLGQTAQPVFNQNYPTMGVPPFQSKFFFN